MVDRVGMDSLISCDREDRIDTIAKHLPSSAGILCGVDWYGVNCHRLLSPCFYIDNMR